MRRLLASVVLLGAVLAPLAAHAGKADAKADPAALLDAVVKAYGGVERLGKVVGYRMEGAVTATIRGSTATTTRLFRRPDQLRVDLVYPDFTEVRVVKEGRGWRTAQTGIAEVTGPMLDSMALQAARSAIPWVLMDHRAALVPAEPADVDGAKLPGLEVTLSPTTTLRAWVDPATHRVLKTQSVLASPQMSMDFSTLYADFRPVDGVLFAFREENFAGTSKTGSTVITKVVLDPPEAVEVPPFDPSTVPPTGNPHAPGGNPHGGGAPGGNPHAGPDATIKL